MHGVHISFQRWARGAGACPIAMVLYFIGLGLYDLKDVTLRCVKSFDMHSRDGGNHRYFRA